MSIWKELPSPTRVYHTPGPELIVPQNPTLSKEAERVEPNVLPVVKAMASVQLSFSRGGGATVGDKVGVTVGDNVGLSVKLAQNSGSKTSVS